MAAEYRRGWFHFSFSLCIKILIKYKFQHANEDVEKMILGNKCDMDEKRIVSKERGDSVSIFQSQTRNFKLSKNLKPTDR